MNKFNPCNSQDMLMHIGIPKKSGRYPWGSGKANGKPAAANPRVKPTAKSDDSKSVEEKPKRKTISEMSDDELKTSIARLELQKKYRDLIGPEPISNSKKVKNFLASASTTAAKAVAIQAMTYAMGSAINKAAGQPVVNIKKAQGDKK